MRNTYSPEFKAKVVREVLREDKTLSQVAAAHGLHPNLVSQWRDHALSGTQLSWLKKKAGPLADQR